MVKRRPKLDDYQFAPQGDLYIDSMDELEKWQDQQIKLKSKYINDLDSYRYWRNRIWQKIVVTVLVVIAVGIGGFFGIRGIGSEITAAEDAYYVGYEQWARMCREVNGTPVGPYDNVTLQRCVFPNGLEAPRPV